MLAAVYHQFKQPLQLQQVPDPKPSTHGVVLEVTATGLCRSDWHGWMGHDPDIRLPHVPGHELAGIVVSKGRGVTNHALGSRVTLPFVGGCGHCMYCRQGDPQVCDNQFQPGFTHWGSFAQYVAIDHADYNLVALPESIDDQVAASLGCRFATAFRALVDQGRVTAEQWIAIFGCGGVGLSAVMIAKALGAQVIAIDLNTSSLELAKEIGADVVLDNSREQIPLAIKNITSGGAHISLDAFGSPDLVIEGLQSLRKRGKFIQVGLMPPEQQKVKLPMDLVVAHELELLGSHGMQAYRYPEMLDMITAGKMNPAKLITNTLTLGNSIEVLIDMDRFDVPGVRIITDFTK